MMFKLSPYCLFLFLFLYVVYVHEKNEVANKAIELYFEIDRWDVASFWDSIVQSYVWCILASMTLLI